jgi:hypothetical protein
LTEFGLRAIARAKTRKSFNTIARPSAMARDLLWALCSWISTVSRARSRARHKEGKMHRRFLMASVAMFSIHAATPAKADLYYFNYHQNSLALRPVQPSLFLFGTAGTSGSVFNGGGFNSPFAIDASGFFNLPIPTTQAMTTTGVNSLGFTINSSAPVSAFFINRARVTTDMSFIPRRRQSRHASRRGLQ